MAVSVVFPKGFLYFSLLIWLWAHETHLYVRMFLTLRLWMMSYIWSIFRSLRCGVWRW